MIHTRFLFVGLFSEDQYSEAMKLLRAYEVKNPRNETETGMLTSGKPYIIKQERNDNFGKPVYSIKLPGELMDTN